MAMVDTAAAAAAARLRRRYARRHVARRIGVYVAAVVASLLCAAPFVWSAITAFKQNRDLYTPANNPFTFNRPATSDHVLYLFERTAFVTFAWNTLWVGALVVGITLLLGLPAAYALARLERPWAGWFGVAIFLVYLVPPTLLFLSMSRVVVALGLQDSTWSLVVVYPTITVPVSVWLLMGFLKTIPRDIEEQAMVDGYSRLAAFWRAVVPLAFPGVVAVVVFAFTLTASEYIYALSFVSPTNQKVISTGVPTELVRGDVFFWQSLQAARTVINDGLTCVEASRRYGPTEATIREWVEKAKHGKLEMTSHDWVADIEDRLALLEQQVMRLRQEVIELAARPVPTPDHQ